MDVDTLVIGSGAGGLTAALALAQAGQRVLVVEQHYLPGGWCHSFTLGGYRFSPGVHYVGELGPGGRARQLFEGLGLGGDIVFLELNPDGYDHAIVGSERFDVPKGREAFGERLKRRFPHEAKGIDRYLSFVARLANDINGDSEVRRPWDLARVGLAAARVARHAVLTLDQLLDRFVRDPILRAVLSIQCGDHGMGPSRAPAAVHAAVAAHYFDGAYYPHGGGFAIPRALLRALRRAGGTLKLRAGVERILVEKRRAIGVRLQDGTEIRAERVISNADPHATYERLVGVEHLSRKLAKRLSRTRYSISALSLFLAADLDARALGYDSGNYWFSRSSRVDDCYRSPLGDDMPGLFLTFTTLKDPSKRHDTRHTIEAFSFVDYEAFRAWARSRYGERPESYKALKEEMTARMLAVAEHVVPGLSKAVVFAELGTPLTNEHFVAATRGCLYGTEKTWGQIGPFAYPTDTEIAGLSMCGASTISHGVFGAMRSGLVTAARILEVPPAQLLREGGAPLCIYPSDAPSTWPATMQPRRAAA